MHGAPAAALLLLQQMLQHSPSSGQKMAARSQDLDRKQHSQFCQAARTIRAFSSQAQRSQQRRQLQKKSSEQGVYLVALVVGMIGLTYASVPLYRCAAGCI